MTNPIKKSDFSKDLCFDHVNVIEDYRELDLSDYGKDLNGKSTLKRLIQFEKKSPSEWISFPLGSTNEIESFSNCSAYLMEVEHVFKEENDRSPSENGYRVSFDVSNVRVGEILEVGYAYESFASFKVGSTSHILNIRDVYKNVQNVTMKIHFPKNLKKDSFKLEKFFPEEPKGSRFKIMDFKSDVSTRFDINQSENGYVLFFGVSNPGANVFKISWEWDI